MWKSCTVDAVVADGFALTGGEKLCARLCFVENRASRYSRLASEASTNWKARSSTQQWPAIVLLARLASEMGQRAFHSSQVTKNANGDELVPEKQLMQKSVEHSLKLAYE